jgi:hypothetical protein
MGGERQDHIKKMFSQPSMAEHFEVSFSPGIFSRSLRSRYEFFKIANDVGIIPKQEWEAIKNAQATYSKQKITEIFFDCLKNIPVTQDRWGSEEDKELHYSVELWRKAKTINRGRAVLGCTFAHLIAIKKFVSEGFDILLEDNVRAPLESCAERVWEVLAASKEAENEGMNCHFRFFGYLGSTPNLKWIYDMHINKRGYKGKTDGGEISFFPLPLPKNIEQDLAELACENHNANESDGETENTTNVRKPGGNAIWGAYAYWISKEAYERYGYIDFMHMIHLLIVVSLSYNVHLSVLERLRSDVGSLLFRGNRSRYYFTKPIDKILPRQISTAFGAASVQLSTHPCFFRAPMLTSKIHTKWDPEFCRSTEYQLQQTELVWSDLWLTTTEREIIRHREKRGEWITIAQLNMIEGQEERINVDEKRDIRANKI